MNNSLFTVIKNACDNVLNEQLTEELAINLIEASLQILQRRRTNQVNNNLTNGNNTEIQPVTNTDNVETDSNTNNTNTETTTNTTNTDNVETDSNTNNTNGVIVTNVETQDIASNPQNRIQLTIMITRPDQVFNNTINI
jgi:hypothetical protein